MIFRKKVWNYNVCKLEKLTLYFILILQSEVLSFPLGFVSPNDEKTFWRLLDA